MPTSTVPRLVRAVFLGTVLLAAMGCDVPSSGPSFETETGVSSPVVMNKTFALLGGGESQHEPLIDTTTAAFDSLFAVADADQSISIEEDVSTFEFGSLDQVLDEATTGFGVESSIETPIIQGGGLATQDVAAQLAQENEVPPPTAATARTEPATSAAIPFPTSFFEVPTLEAANIDANQVKAATFTNETSYDNAPANRITFRLRNEGTSSPSLTDGSGNAPRIQLTDENGTVIADRPFEEPIDPGGADTVQVRVDGEILGENAEIELTLDGQDPTEDKLDIELSPLRYQEAVLGGVTSVGITASDTLSTQDGNATTQVAGIEVQDGPFQLEVTNQFAFPIQVDNLRLTNHLQNSALPDSFPALDVAESDSFIPSGQTETLSVDLAGRGVANRIAVQVEGGLADGRDEVTISATDRFAVSAGGELTVRALYFWPNGEEVSASGQVAFDQDRIRFEDPEDFVELGGGAMALNRLVNESAMTFESLTLRLPDITRQGNPLALQLEAFPQSIEKELTDFQLSPTNNEVAYDLRGTLETISTPTSSNLQVVRATDSIRADVSIDNLDVRAVEATVNPFTVDLTEDANGDGRLDLAQSQEARQASFGNFNGVTERVEDLRLTGTELTVRTTTDVGTDLQLIAALQGRGGETREFLAGESAEKSVSSPSSMGDDLYVGTAQIAKEHLIQLGIQGAPTNDPVSRRIRLTQDNSTVDDFLNAFPSSLRFVAQARLTGDENGQIQLRRPLTFETGLSVSVPVRVKGDFTVRDTIEADFSSLDDVTDPTNDVTVSSAELRVRYTNGIPLGAAAELVVLDGQETQVLTLPGEEETVRIKPPAKADDGTADGSASGTSVLDLTVDQLRALAEGRRVALRLTLDQADAGGPATLRATDTIALSLEAEVETTVSVNN